MQTKVGIVTWMGFPNFGTSLQAYALRTVLKRGGYEARFVDDTELSRDYIRRRYALRNPIRRLLAKIYNLVLPRTLTSPALRRYIPLHRRSLDLFASFSSRHLPLLPPDAKADAFIAGSDQIWSASLPLDTAYMSHFFLVGREGAKIAYAPSLGVAPDAEEEYISVVRPWLADFKALSAREPAGAALLSRAIGREVSVMPDPTLLLDAEDWADVMEPECEEPAGPYCLLYLLSYNPRIVSQAEAYARRHGLELVTILNHYQLLDRQLKAVSVGPSGFLHLLSRAEAVITDSFHGTIFATVFSRPSATFRRFAPDDPTRQNRRLDHFFSAIGSTKSMIPPEAELSDELVCREDPAWRERLAPIRREALDFLFSALPPSSSIRP